METEHTVRDIYENTRPTWSFAANLEEATAALQIALSDEQSITGLDISMDAEERDLTSDSEEDRPDADGDVDDDSMSDEELEV
jgi:hypothetical protein